MPDWMSEDLATLLLVIGAGVLLAILKEAREAWRQDRPWFGWDLRRLSRHPDDPDPPP
jgi:hypothetical protein